MNSAADAEDVPILPAKTRRRIWISIVTIVVAVVVILSVLFSIEAEETQVQTLLPAGSPTGSYASIQNSSYQFSTGEPGVLSGSWGESESPGWPGATVFLYPEGHCIGPHYPYNGPACTGTPIWQGPPNGGSGFLTDDGFVETYPGDLNVTVSAGSYLLLFVGHNATESSPEALVVTPITLSPTPWWWL